MNKLVKAKITFTTDIVVEVDCNESIMKHINDVESVWENNSDSIIAQTDKEPLIVINSVDSLNDLPPDWESGSYPWTNLKRNHGEEKQIKEFFKK